MMEQICPGCGMPHRGESAYCSPECVDLDPDTLKRVVPLTPRKAPALSSPAVHMNAEIIPFRRVPVTVSRHRKQRAIRITAKYRREDCQDHCSGYSWGLYCYPDCKKHARGASPEGCGMDIIHTRERRY